MTSSAKKACKRADHVLSNTCGYVKVGAITYEELQKIFEENGSKKLTDLCTAARLNNFKLLIELWMNNLNAVVQHVKIVRLFFYEFLKPPEGKSVQGEIQLYMVVHFC